MSGLHSPPMIFLQKGAEFVITALINLQATKHRTLLPVMQGFSKNNRFATTAEHH